MNSSYKILYHSLVAPFYRQIFGALLFVFFLLFGIQQNLYTALQTNYYIMLAIIQKPLGLLIFALLTLLYSLKCISYLSNCFKKEAFTFLSTMNALPQSKKIIYNGWVSACLLLPVIVYASILIIISILQKYFFSAFALVMLICINTIVVLFFFNRYLKQLPVFYTSRFKLFKLPTNLYWIWIKFFFTKQLRVFFIVKLLSFTTLYYFVMFTGSAFEERMLWLIFFTSLMAHCVIIYKNFYFTENEMSFYRNMPLSYWKILSALFVLYLAIFLPEIWALRSLGFLHGYWYSYTCMIITGPLFLQLLHVLLYTDDMSLKNYIPLAMGVWLVFFFFSLSDNKWLVPAIALTGVIMVFFTSFKNFEKKAEVEKLE